MFDFLGKKEKMNTPAVSTFQGLFGGKFFGGRTSDFADKYIGWVNLAIRIKAQECASTKLKVYRKNQDGELEEVKNTELNRLIEKPNTEMTTRDLIEWISSFLDIDGNAYIFKVGKKELWPLRSDWVTIVPSKTEDKLIERYEYKKGKTKVKLGVEEVIHFKEFNPKFFNEKTPYKGMGIIEASRKTIDEDENIKDWNAKFFKQGATPNGVLEYDGVLSEEEKNRIERKWRQNNEGVENAGKVPFLQGGLKYKKVGLSQRELDFIAQRKLDRDDIFAMFGVPKGLLLSDDVNLANAKMALWSFTRFTISPRLKKIEEILTNQLAKEFGEQYVLKFDNPVPEDREAKINEYDKGVGRWLTVNEVRREEGLEDIEGGDEIEKETTLQQKSVNDFPNERVQRGEKAWKSMIEIQESWEDKYRLTMKKYFFGLRLRILDKIKEKSKGKNQPDYVNKDEEVEILFDLLTPLQREYFETEGNRAMVELGVDKDFVVDTKKLEKYDLFLAKKLTETTIKDIRKILKETSDMGIDIISEKISEYFNEAEKYRAERIARSETIKTANSAMEEAWKQSEVVKAKEWYTSNDERVCEYCSAMDGKTIRLGKAFKKRGDKVLDMELNYRTIKEPPLHSQCRCVLLPVVK